MDYDLFINLYKHKETEGKSDKENFLTEMFAYILKLLAHNYKKDDKTENLFFQIFQIFKIDIAGIKSKNIKIKTQCNYPENNNIYKKKTQPDIKIKIDDKVYFIENKIDSKINQYPDINKDQIELYEAIILDGKEENCGIRTLTKYNFHSTSKSFKDEYKVFWYQIYELVKNSEKVDDLIIKNFLSFLEENNMEGRKPLESPSQQKLDISSFDTSTLFIFFRNTLLYDIFKPDGDYNSLKPVEYKTENDYYWGFEISYKNCIRFGWYMSNPNYMIAESKIISINEAEKELTKGIKEISPRIIQTLSDVNLMKNLIKETTPEIDELTNLKTELKKAKNSEKEAEIIAALPTKTEGLLSELAQKLKEKLIGKNLKISPDNNYCILGKLAFSKIINEKEYYKQLDIIKNWVDDNSFVSIANVICNLNQ